MDMNNEEKKEYGIFSNISYALKNIWEWDKSFYLFFIPLVPISVFISVLEIYFPKILIDSLEKKCSIRFCIEIICIYFAVLFVQTIIRFFCNAELSARKYSFSYRYQNKIWEKYMRTDFSNTDSPAENIKFQNAINDANSNCSPEVVWQSLFNLFISLLGLFTYGSIIISVSPWILLLLFVSASVTYLIGRWQRNYTEKNKNHIASLDRKIGYLSNLSSNFDYAKDIRIFDLAKWISNMLVGLHNDKVAWHKKINIRTFLGIFFNGILALIRDGAAYAFLILMLLNNKIETGDFVFLFGAIVGFSVWLNGISGQINDVIGKGVKIGYYREYFNIKDKFNHNSGCELPRSSELPIEIRFENVSYKYPSSDVDNYALRDINLTIHPGERIAIVGANGAGKTTLVKLLCGLYYPSSGEVIINGKRTSEYNIDEYYTMFSVVFQDIYLLPITIEEFISSSDESIDESKINSAIRRAGLSQKISSLPNGIKTHLVKGVFNDSIDLSGGEKQKLMLARALYKNAPVIVLDEPTAALDPIAENDIYLQYGNFTEGKTSVYISHRLASTRFCDRIIYIEDSRIIEEGSHEELIKLRGKYYAMYELQSQYYKENNTQ